MEPYLHFFDDHGHLQNLTSCNNIIRGGWEDLLDGVIYGHEPHHHAYQCPKTKGLPRLVRGSASISQVMSTRSIIDDSAHGANIAITRGISTLNVAFLINSAIFKDGRSALFLHSIASTNRLNIQFALTMECTAFECGNKNNEWSSSRSKKGWTRRTQVCLRQSYVQVGHMIVHDSSCMHGFEGSSKPLGGRPTWIVVRVITKKPHYEETHQCRTRCHSWA